MRELSQHSAKKLPLFWEEDETFQFVGSLPLFWTMNDVTVILAQMEKGEASSEELLNVVYEELRILARSKMAGERQGHTLQATALVHEAWLGLGGDAHKQWENRRHFFGAAAEAMRRILVNHARQKNALKRGGGGAIGELTEDMVEFLAPVSELLAVHEVMSELEEEDPETAELIKLRYFVGMTMQETADAMGLKKRTAEGIWQFGRVWLKQRLS
ncbi:ECF-type sigma factor [Akkermansiaceae bacterium]|nr:ECF-type sigma factor [Akkermansiaceae bacterium]